MITCWWCATRASRRRRTANARDQFNHRVACYRIGLRLIHKLFPQYVPLVHHLRDVNVRTLGVPLSWIYKILLRLPEQATRDQLRALLPDAEPDGGRGEQRLDALFSTHCLPQDGLYPIRGVVLYGLAECERSGLFADALKANRIAEIGRLMNVSHDGDRTMRSAADGRQEPYCAPTSNGYLLDLIDDLESGIPERVVGAQLEWQPGSYHCSVPEIDLMVRHRVGQAGSSGRRSWRAQGWVGVSLVLAHRDAVPELLSSLRRQYYEPLGKLPTILMCKPVAGSGVLLQNDQ